MKSKTRGTTEPRANKSGLKRRLADQLTTVFIVGLLCLWLSTPNVHVEHVERGPWLPWLIASIVVFVVVFVWFACKRKKVRWPKLWWVFPFAAAALLWLMYFLKGVSFPSGCFRGLAIVLLTCAVVLLLALVLIMTRWGSEGKLGKAITWVVKQGDDLYRWLSVLVLWASVLMGWVRLQDAGIRGWLMDVLLCLGLLIAIVVSWVQLSTRHQEDGS